MVSNVRCLAMRLKLFPELLTSKSLAAALLDLTTLMALPFVAHRSIQKLSSLHLTCKIYGMSLVLLGT